MARKAHFILVNVGYAEHHADWNYQQVVSPFIRIYKVDRGRAKIHLQDKVIDMEQGFLYIVPAYCMHNYECDGEFALYYIHLYENACNAPIVGENYVFQYKVPMGEVDAALIAYLFKMNPNCQLHSYNPKSYNNHFTLMETIHSSALVPMHQQLETEGVLQILMGRFLKYARPKSVEMDDRVARALVYIRKHLSEPLDVAALAAHVHISTEYFTRLFTQELGESPIRYIQLRKIQRAQLLLTLEDMPIKELAYGLGFNYVSYFNKVFKRIVGCTPKVFKERH